MKNWLVSLKKNKLTEAIVKARNLAGSEEVYKVTKEEISSLPKKNI